MNLNTTIIPKSDQLNADDLIGGPRTIKITSVESGSQEQPVVIHYEGDFGRPYKPSKSMRRVLVSIWGADGSAYIGRRISIYRDPLVKFGGDAVGGVKISHASDISEPLSILLTETRGRRKPHRVAPLEPETPVVKYPAGWVDWTDEMRGSNRAHLGVSALAAWWATLPGAEQKKLKPTLDAEWKPIAEEADKKA
jgi:hypothetical protein